MTDKLNENQKNKILEKIPVKRFGHPNEIANLVFFLTSTESNYITGQNLFTWTDYTGFDPEVTSFMWTGLIQGVDWHSPPNAKNILVGINMNF